MPMTFRGIVIRNPTAAAEAAEIRLSRGRIADISPVDTLPAGAPCILPGFIDSHTHPIETGLELLFVDLKDATCVDDAADRLRAFLRQHDEGPVVAFNLEPDRLRERRYPTTSELDRVTGRVPTIVYRVDGHSAVLNTAGLEAVAAQTARTVLVVDGVLRGGDYEVVSRAFKALLSPTVIQRALAVAGERAAAAGVCTLGAFVGDEDLVFSQWNTIIDGLNAMCPRAVPYLQTWNPEVPAHYGLRQIGGCLLIDGSFGSRTAALASPYSDDAGNSGVCYETDDRLVDFYRSAESAGLQTAVHSIGDRALDQVLRCMARTIAPGNRLRHRIEHAELLTAGIPVALAEQKAVLGMQPAFEAEWGGPTGMYSARLGRRWRLTNRFRALLDLGVVVAGGSDSPITPIDPVAGIAAAIGHPNETERAQPDEALAMFTAGAAYALNLEARAGRIAPGLDADLVLLTADPRTDSAASVIATIRSGQVIYRASDTALRSRLPVELL